MNSLGRIALPTDRAGVVPARGEAAPVRAVIRAAAEAVETLAADWTELAGRAAEPNAFAEHWFVAAALKTVAPGRDLRLVEVRRGGRLIGLVIVEVATGYARLPVRIVRNWCHDQAFLGTPLVAAGEERAFWAAAVAALDAADPAPNLLHLRRLAEGGPVHRGLPGAAVVHRRLRAFLDSALDPRAYYEQAVRPKKRKELRRLRNRLGELGRLESRLLGDRGELDAWCDAFLALEQAGWKGRVGTALAAAPAAEHFFREALARAWDAGRLQFRRLDLDGRPIAMLVNFLCAPGSFSFKTAFDEEFAHYSPGVLIQLDNLAILDDPDIAWMDSCAAQDHPMIDSLWTERRAIVRATVRFRGARRTAVWALCRALELGSAALRGGKL
ncbi:MAG TPA: GNAT family N-acetyltransferase [Allosphingosinicella sp.]|nr:GNAT family N-acetyltransferase [Allosphingosinicella sp.]